MFLFSNMIQESERGSCISNKLIKILFPKGKSELKKKILERRDEVNFRST